ncbi:transposase domain-containing protein [Enterococcus cecorum]|uniref:Transposase domain-containing protein n=1 Tax=Enterococcus cecorum TaxID=44008 RepID=A0AAW9K0U2_9ENTE|nr:transposase domain-containing protein [Enterococcus cecorum]MDZ5505530.1 transposase domain-containing protein [Enterococcus cecorum]MDZ5532961.1 transposase domain-containing protein [Enterococcus cecorum]MDZ5546234.1 transposase domain-containing protein [Enterococcus cecorum]MDZ5550782.1 transposase domain-containing protein [Enterococcus cecorum]MDZ5552930.1 transposase domain-containing protein [Enterococcus cecorum]
MMKQPIVPLEMSKTGMQHFNQRTKNELLLRCKVGAIELSFFSSLDATQRNGLDSEKYLTYLLEKLPNEESFAKKVVLEAYLPWSETVQTNCK